MSVVTFFDDRNDSRRKLIIGSNGAIDGKVVDVAAVAHILEQCYALISRLFEIDMNGMSVAVEGAAERMVRISGDPGCHADIGAQLIVIVIIETGGCRVVEHAGKLFPVLIIHDAVRIGARSVAKQRAYAADVSVPVGGVAAATHRALGDGHRLCCPVKAGARPSHKGVACTSRVVECETGCFNIVGSGVC